MRLLSTIIILFLIGQISSQDLNKLYFPKNEISTQLPIELLTEVKSFDDFIGRYNGKLNAYGEKIDFNNIQLKSSRNPALISKLRYSIIGSFLSSNLLDKYNDAIEEFVRNASNGKLLDFKETDWNVIIPITGQFENKDISANLIMNIQYTEGNKCKWIISNVQFDVTPKIKKLKFYSDICDEVYIPPSAHDNGFIAVKNIFKDANLLHYHIIKVNSNLELLNALLINGYKPTFTSYFYHIRVNNDVNFILNNSFKITQIL